MTMPESNNLKAHILGELVSTLSWLNRLTVSELRELGEMLCEEADTLTTARSVSNSTPDGVVASSLRQIAGVCIDEHLEPSKGGR